MRAHRSTAIVLLVIAGLGAAACGSDDAGDDAAPATSGGPSAVDEASGEPATQCATGSGDVERTVTLRVDDVEDGSGSLGSRAPSELAAGPARLVVEADDGNGGPVDVVVSGPDGFSTSIAGVGPGVTCAVDVDLAAGEYAITSDGNPGADAAFTVLP